MPTKTFDIEQNIAKDSLAESIAQKWTTWLNSRQHWEEQYRRVLQYLYSTTTDTIYGQASNPWAANVHIPKLTQLRDVLITYILESVFSLKDYYTFHGFTADAETKRNRNLIRDLMREMLEEGNFKEVVGRLVEDYIDAGNAFAMPVFDSVVVEDSAGVKQLQWEGVKALRINPLDITFDPMAVSFKDSPKIIRTVLSLGELATLAEKDPIMKEGLKKALEKRRKVREAMTNGDTIKEEQLEIAGFGSMSSYMSSDSVELLTFYGSLYDVDKEELHRNTKITIIDRNTVLKEEPMEAINGCNYIFKTGYRDRKDILWSMGPLDNLLGMQARIDFLENKRSDCYDFAVNPVKIIKGQVDMPDTTAPGDEIRMDIDSDVRYLAPDTTILSADNLINNYEIKMEEFVGSPKEVLGFRTPGEKTMFEVNQLMTAATRLFNKQIAKFEREILEPLLNAMLQKYIDTKAGQTLHLRSWNAEMNYYEFIDIPVEDLKTMGKIVVKGSEIAQDKAQMAQALQMLGQNPLFLDEAVLNNFSPAVLGQIFEYVSGLDRFTDLYKKDQRLYEITSQQKLVEQLSQQVDEVRAQSLADAQEGADQAALYNEITQQRILGTLPDEEG